MLNTSLHDWHAAHGAKLVDFAGWHMPVLYTSLVEEHTAVRQRVGLFDVAHMGRLRFSGPDALPFLEQLLTTDCGKLAVGDVKYSLVCQPDGGILDDVLLYRREQGWQLVVNASNREKLLAWFGQQVRGRDIGLVDETVSTCMIAVQGPRSCDLLGPLSSAEVLRIEVLHVHRCVGGGDPLCGEPDRLHRRGRIRTGLPRRARDRTVGEADGAGSITRNRCLRTWDLATRSGSKPPCRSMGMK